MDSGWAHYEWKKGRGHCECTQAGHTMSGRKGGGIVEFSAHYPVNLSVVVKEEVLWGVYAL